MRPRLTPDGNVLITGLTGLIGGELFRTLAARGHAGNVWALVRPTVGRDPDARVRERLARSGDRGPPGCRLTPVAGDILEPHWGLSRADRDEIAAGVDVIVHSAADTSFAARPGVARTNVEGVRRLIEFARSCRRNPLVVYLSTASNVGRVAGRCVAEDHGCRPENDHFNEYTHSKAVGEWLVRESGLPVLVLRPTIVLSGGLPDPRFARQILWCAPLGRVFRALPVDPAGRIDVVDVEFVAEAAVRLMTCRTRSHDCYHLSAGPGGAVTVGEVSGLVDRAYGRRTPLRLIPPGEWTRAEHRTFVRTRLQREVFRSLRHYLPFLNMDVVYDDARLRADLGAAAPAVRPLDEYLPDLLRRIRSVAALREAALP
ncbi:MAG TPA: SDR family oxidoreductase [Gemmataceae bacterium]|nr:SDR family oxidoreductase [Gemmataceae bacterium]